MELSALFLKYSQVSINVVMIRNGLLCGCNVQVLFEYKILILMSLIVKS